MAVSPSVVQLCLVLLFLVGIVSGHAHHDELTEEQSNAPIDAILWIHMFLQAAVWGIIFPIGMVLGITRSRWHVPLQVSISIGSGYQNIKVQSTKSHARVVGFF